MKNRAWLGALVAFVAIAGDVSLAGRTALAAPPPRYGAHGFDVAGADTAARPGNGFFRYANGTWVDRAEIPADKAATSLRIAMTDLTEQRLRELMEAAALKSAAAPGDLESKVGAFYRSFMDTARIESLGAAPLATRLASVRAARTRGAIAALMGRANQDFFGALFNAWIDVDVKDPARYAIYLGQGGLGLPNRDYYTQPSFAAQKAKYGTYAEELLRRIGWPAPEQAAREVVALESAIAESSWAMSEQRDAVKTYNPVPADSLAVLAPGFAWTEFLEAQGVGGARRVIVNERSAFPKLAAIFARTPVATLQAWLAFTVADNAAPLLSRPFEEASFELRKRTLSGQLSPGARWKRGVRAVSGGDVLSGDRFDRFGNMGWGVGQLYTARFFPPEAKAGIESLVVNLTAAYRARIERLEWMSPATRAAALHKLETYAIKVGYPNRPRDYSGLEIRGDDLVGNVLRSAEADWKFYVSRMGGPVDRDDWIMTPQTNNAYNGSLRDIVFPAGILQPPIFDPNADPAFNYGAAGGIIGHELTHGFDDEGRKFDADGRLNDWWTPADAKQFEARSARLGEQYNSYEPLPGLHINGKLTMGENIADLGGLTLALDAYRASLRGKPAPVLDGFTGDQRVLLGWAQAWRGKLRDEAIRRQVVSDPHSYRVFRVDGVVRNLDEWYDAFGVTPGDKLYLAPGERVRIW